METKKIKKAYKDILSVCEKYAEKDFLSDSEFSDIRDMEAKAKNHLILIDWNEKYGLDLKHDIQIYQYNWAKIDDKRCFVYYQDAEKDKEKGNGRYISWSDDGKQPKDEWLFNISFSTGAYIFGDDYPTELFQKFWLELKSYKPKYCDTQNKSMYFALENSKKIYDEYQNILNKYREINKKDYKKRKIEKLKKDIEILETKK